MDRIVKRYHGFVRLKASSYFLVGGDWDDLVQEGLVGLYKAVRDYRTDRESSFRNFAELCITRQIITAVKTSTRNKHAPLNEYISFAQTPATAGDGEQTLEDVLPGPTVHDPAIQVISSEELHSLVGCLTSARSSSEEITWLTGSWTLGPGMTSSSVGSPSVAPAGGEANDTYWLSGTCLLRVAVLTAVMIWRVMQSSAKLRKLDSRSVR